MTKLKSSSSSKAAPNNALIEKIEEQSAELRLLRKEVAALFKISKVTVERGHYLVDSLLLGGHRAENGRSPFDRVVLRRGFPCCTGGIHSLEVNTVVRGCAAKRNPLSETEHQVDIVAQAIGFVDDENV